jgi:hypothetical protein
MLVPNIPRKYDTLKSINEGKLDLRKKLILALNYRAEFSSHRKTRI